MNTLTRLSKKSVAVHKEAYEPTSIDSFFWTNDSTEFEHRCRIALEVLRYVRDNGTRIEPVWRQCTPQQLIRQS